MLANKPLVPTRKSEALLLAAQRRRQMTTFRHTAVLGLCALAAACTNCSSSIPGDPISAGAPVNYELLSAEIVSPYSGGIDVVTRRLLKSRAEWEALWMQMEPRTSRIQGQVAPNPLPEIDFGQHALIVAAMGRRPNGCCSVEITSVVETADRVVVTVLERTAGHNCVVTTAVTHPIALALIAQTPKRAEFEVIEKTQQCQ